MDALDARSLRYVLAVARTGSIRGAAEFLHVVPSAVSRQELPSICSPGVADRLTRGEPDGIEGSLEEGFKGKGVTPAVQLRPGSLWPTHLTD